jgi:hypothetical protein
MPHAWDWASDDANAVLGFMRYGIYLRSTD